LLSFLDKTTDEPMPATYPHLAPTADQQQFIENHVLIVAHGAV